MAKVLIIPQLRSSDAWLVFVARTLRFKVLFVHMEDQSSKTQRILRKGHVEPVSLETVASLQHADHLETAIPRAAQKVVDMSSAVAFLEDLVSSQSLTKKTAERLKIALVTNLCEYWTTLGPIGIFHLNRPDLKPIVITRWPWESLVLRKAYPQLRTIFIPPMGDLSRSLIVRLRRTLSFALVRKLIPGGHNTRPSARSASAQVNQEQKPQDFRDGEILMVAHKGLRYGNAFAWDQWFSKDSASPLHPGKLVFGCYFPTTSDECPPGFLNLTLNENPPRLPRWFWVSLLHHIGSALDIFMLLLLARQYRQVIAVKEIVRRHLPNTRIAIFLYDMLVPPSVSIGLSDAGIMTTALQERPMAVVDISMPKLIDLYLVACEDFVSQIHLSPTAGIEEAVAVGMWRTDKFRRLKSQQYRNEIVGGSWKHLVIALPLLVAADEAQARNTWCCSTSAMKNFIDSILTLSLENPDTLFVVRAKDNHWMTLPSFDEILTRLSLTENIQLSILDDTLDMTYRLCANADAVVGMHSSILEECLAVGVPTIIHDFTHNCSGVMKETVSYLPEEIWALNDTSLALKLKEILLVGGRQSSILTTVLNDGSVSQRAQTLIETRLMEMTSSGGRRA